MIKLLLQNEMNIFKNSHFKTRKQVCIFLISAILKLMFAGGITWLVAEWARPLLTLFPPQQARTLVMIPLLYSILLASLLTDFTELMLETRTKFYHSPELSLFFAAPLPAATLFFCRFFLSICFSRGALWGKIIILVPIIALGIVTAASWHYYLFILPVVYLLRVIGGAVGSLISMLLVGILPTRRMTQAAVFFGLLSVGLGIGIIIFWDLEHALPWLLSWVEIAKPIFFPVTDGVAALNCFALGQLALASGSLPRLFLTAVVALGVSMLVAEKIYSTGYDKSQTIDVHTKKQAALPAKALPTKQRFFLGRKSSLILNEWQKAARNYEMIQATIFFLIILLSYFLTAGRIRLPDPWQDLIFLAHVGMVGFIVSVGINALFISADITQDIKAYKEKEYGLLKTAPVGGMDALLCYWLAPFIVNAAIGAVLLFLLIIFSGVGVLTSFYYVMVLILLIGAMSALGTAKELAPSGEASSLIGSVLSAVLPFCYYIMALGILAVGEVYTEIGFLSFLHHLPPGLLTAVTGAVFLGVVGCTLYYSFRLGVKSWEEMEI